MEKESNPLISILLPVYNGEKTILRAVRSILAQTYPHWELVIINDGSSDRTLNVINSIKDPKIKTYTIPRFGVAKALNFGVKMARGTYIARMDADDISLPERLKNQVAYLRDHSEIDLVACQVKHIGAPGREGYEHYVNWINQLITSSSIYLARYQEAPFAHPSVMFRKSTFNKYGGYTEEVVPEDFELWLKWLQNGVRMAKLPEVLLEWYDSPNRLSRISTNYSHEHFSRIKARYFSQWYRRKNLDRPVWIFGSGRTVNHRVKPLINYGLRIDRFIDVKPTSHHQFAYYKDVPNA